MIYRSLIKPKHEAGFGLLSIVLGILLVSVSVVGILSLLKSSGFNRDTKITMDRASDVSAAIVRYRNNHNGTSPTSLDHLVTTDGGAACALDNNSSSATYLSLQGWCGPYLNVNFQEFATQYKTDSWGTLFTWSSATGILKSCGPDLTCGNSDDLSYTP